MSYTSFGQVRIWDGTEAVSVHGASSAIGDSINGSVVPSFVDETARNTAAAALIADGKTGMTCHVKSRRGTCTFIGIPAGGAPPVNGWVWQAQNRIVGEGYLSGWAGSSGGNANFVSMLALPSIPLPGGQRQVTVYYGCDIQPSLSSPNLAVAGGALVLYINGVPAAGEIQRAAVPVVPATMGGFYTQSLLRTAVSKINVAAAIFDLRVGMYTSGGGYLDAMNPRMTVVDNGPVD